MWGTNRDHVDKMHEAFKEWVIRLHAVEDVPSQHRDRGLVMYADIPGSTEDAKQFLASLSKAESSPKLWDSRLSKVNTYLFWGLEPSQVGTLFSPDALTGAERLQYMVRHIIHLRSNCADTMMCNRCNGSRIAGYKK